MQNKLQHIKEFIKKHKTLFIVLTVLKLLLKIGIVLYFVCKVNDVAAQSTNKILRQGNKEYYNQKYNNATESYSKALQKEPKDVRAHFNQGDALFQLNELDKAKESYSNAAKLSTNTNIQAKCFYNIGNAFYKQEKWEESAKAYKTSLKLNPKDNTIIVGKKPALEVNEVVGEELNLYIDDKKFSCGVKLRYRSNTILCNVEIINDKAIIKLKEPAFGVASGQLAVFYDGNRVIGSAFIKSAK